MAKSLGNTRKITLSILPRMTAMESPILPAYYDIGVRGAKSDDEARSFLLDMGTRSLKKMAAHVPPSVRKHDKTIWYKFKPFPWASPEQLEKAREIIKTGNLWEDDDYGFGYLEEGGPLVRFRIEGSFSSEPVWTAIEPVHTEIALSYLIHLGYFKIFQGFPKKG